MRMRISESGVNSGKARMVVFGVWCLVFGFVGSVLLVGYGVVGDGWGWVGMDGDGCVE